MKLITTLFILLFSYITTAQTPIENKTLGISFTPSSQIENTKDLETFIADLGRVELVYLEGNCEPIKSATPIENISNEPCIRRTIIKSYDKINSVVSWDSSYYSKRTQVKDRDLSDIFELLYGSKFSPSIGSITVAGCYEPRNGIVFYSAKNEAVGFLEICFDCHILELTSELPAINTLSDEELKKLKSLFTNNGIPTTEKDIFEYERFNLHFKTSKTVEEKEELTQFLNTVYRVEFVRLMGECHHEKFANDNSFTEECFPKSIIHEFKDSTFQPKKDFFRQTVKVKKEDLDEIFNILYKKRELSNIITNYDCYNPRNGILFYDKNNQVFAFFEICFECQGKKTTSNIPSMDRLTRDEYNELKVLFNKYGINTKEQ